MHDRNNTPAVVTAMTLLVVGLLVLGAAGLLAFRWFQVSVQSATIATAQESERAAQARAAAALARAQAAVVQAAPPSDDGDRVAAVDAAVREVLRQQQQAWNAGDIERFMQHYWPSDNLTFSSRGKVTRSWQSVLESYRQRYASREAMGELTLDQLEVTPLGSEAALVLGNWTLRRQDEAQPLRGNFTLVFRRLDGKWLIIHDHTSRAEEP